MPLNHVTRGGGGDGGMVPLTIGRRRFGSLNEIPVLALCCQSNSSNP